MATTQQSPRYQVQVHSANSWHADGSPVIERRCDHSHRTLSGAARCCAKLTRNLSGRNQSPTYDARWWRADVYHRDGSKLGEIEAEQLVTIRCHS